MFIFRWSWIAIIFVVVLLGTGCTAHSGNTHNDQRNCTHDCNIGSSEPYYAPAPVYVAPVVTHYPAVPIFRGYGPRRGHRYGHRRGHRRGYRGGYFRGSIFIHN